MSNAIISIVDTSILHALRAKRRAREPHALEKLRLLRRLRRRLEQKAFPKETSAEASFIERLFVNLFGFSTLLSNDESRYSLYTKPTVNATTAKPNKRFPDAGIGVFGAPPEDLFASMELKGSDTTDLDKPQTGDAYKGLSPVQQAFQAVKGENKCLWVLVSNMRELRLYRRIDLSKDTDTPPGPVAHANLSEIYNRNDLAILCAHFDRAALLGPSLDTPKPEESELMKALENKSSVQPVPKVDGYLRLNLFFTPSRDEDIALSFIERKLRASVKECETSLGALGFQTAPDRIKLEHASIHFEWGDEGNPDVRISMSGEGQLMMSVRKEAKDNKMEVVWLVKTVRFFFQLAQAFFQDLSETPGFVTAELRDVKDICLVASGSYAEADMPNQGKCESGEVTTIDFRYRPLYDAGERLTAELVNELAVYFRADGKGGVVVNRAAIGTKS